MAKILIVEDEVMVLSLLEDFFTITGHTISIARKLPEAIALATMLPLDAAVLDVIIIGGNTFVVAEVLVERHIPFIFITGWLPDNAEVPDALKDAPFLTKPVRMTDLHTIMRALVADIGKPKGGQAPAPEPGNVNIVDMALKPPAK